MIKSYKSFINESIKDLMKPKSEEDIIKVLQDLNPQQRMRKAIQYGLLSVVKNIIENGIDLKKNTTGNTPIGYTFVCDAVEYGKLDILKYLLDNGCDLGGMENSHLHEAIVNNHYKVAKFLVDEHNATIDNDDEEDDIQYLGYAISNDNLDMVKLVIDLGCNYYDEDWIRIALLSNTIKPEIIKYIMNKIPDFKEYIKKMYNYYKNGLEIIEKYI